MCFEIAKPLKATPLAQYDLSCNVDPNSIPFSVLQQPMDWFEFLAPWNRLAHPLHSVFQLLECFSKYQGAVHHVPIHQNSYINCRKGLVINQSFMLSFDCGFGNQIVQTMTWWNSFCAFKIWNCVPSRTSFHLKCGTALLVTNLVLTKFAQILMGASSVDFW